ncbi:reticulon-4-interacting protein 1 homolog, mitochondrial [Bacillus rossius redtenbacheri]|uniref:reticulon-4-interacting protein 1 homolog, mitochondrial n=1 Tax=Bacillus rossius redtenbacheri TaxID=93214 RepID=UPI002FDDC32B
MLPSRSIVSYFISTRAFYSAVNVNKKCKESQMQAWQIHAYGGVEELQLSRSARAPQITKPDDVLVEVAASSVNPIDVAMLGGYGSGLLGVLRQVSSCSLQRTLEFPLTLGRDFAGRVVGKGHGVNSELELGDEVWGAAPPHSQGSHAERVVVSKSLVFRKPSNLTTAEASAVPYAGMTAWCALKVTGDLGLLPARGKRVLVLGGVGGVGSLAIQLLRAWGCTVVATCSTDAVHLVESLGAHCVVDYTHPDASRIIREEGKYDVILDAAGLGAGEAPSYAGCLRDWSLSKYVTLRSPLLRHVDAHGLAPGLARSAAELLLRNVQLATTSAGSTVRWGFFMPVPAALRELSRLVEEGKVMPLVEKVFKFEDLPAAYERVKQGHLRGKVVVAMGDTAEQQAQERVEVVQ